MAAGKNIEIKIAATGAQQAAAEIGKVDAALESAGNQGLGGSARKTADGLAQISKAQGNVSTSLNSSRFAVQNAAFQFQDMAVQLEMGTNATRVFSQQVPQLLGSFGAVGAVAGAVIGIGLPLAAALFRSGDEAESAGEKIKGLTEIMDGYKDAAKEAALARDAANLAEWFQNLDEEEAKIEKTNDALKRQIELETKLRVLKSGVEAARRDVEIANIEANPDLSDDEKTRRTAGVREQGERANAQAKIEALRAEAIAADKAAADAAALAARQEQDAADAAAKRKQIEDEQAKNQEQARIAAEELPKLEKEKLDFASSASARGASMTPRSAAEIQADIDKAAEIQSRIDAAKQASGGDLTTEQRAAKQEADKKQLETAKAEEKKQQDQAKAARDAADSTAGQAADAAALFRKGVPLISEQYQQQAEARRRRTEATAAKQAAEAKQRADAKADEAEQKERTSRLEDAEDGLNSNARDRGLVIRNAGNRRGNETLKSVGKALADGTNEAELQKLGDQVKEAQARNGAAMTGALQKVLAELNTQAQQINTLKEQIKRGRPGK